jgi:hypothetical protein
MTTKQQARAIYASGIPGEKSKWEHTDAEYIAKYGHAGGLLLAGCPKCGEFQTRETYVEGFWAEVAEGFHWQQPWTKVRHFDFKDKISIQFSVVKGR